jgi:hypothetical protein
MELRMQDDETENPLPRTVTQVELNRFTKTGSTEMMTENAAAWAEEFVYSISNK